MEEILRPISLTDHFALREMDLLLRQEGLQRDNNLEYICGIYDIEDNLIAVGGCFGCSIRCLAVSGQYRGQGYLVRIVSHLLEVQARKGNLHVFLYTKCDNLPFFSDLGFHEVARVKDQMVFLENRRGGFEKYCAGLKKTCADRIAAVVMNANPFTLGHRHLLEQACRENDAVYLFLLSEESGPIPYAVRHKLVSEGIRHLHTVILQETGPYMISSATFPSYFLKDQDSAISAQALLDAEVFARIAACLGITSRYLGEEPSSHVTGIYNRVLACRLPELGIQCRIIPRLTVDEAAISAGTVRKAIHDGNMEQLRKLVPESTRDYFLSSDAEPVLEKIRRETELFHY